jgi:CRISPR-associated protein Cas2
MAGENETSFYVITYDIPSDRRRTKVANTLEDYGERVQYSVFEANLTARQFARLKKKLSGIIEPEEDSIRYYFLCQACVERIEIEGQGAVTQDPELWVI